jgi:hypothetical protein
MYKTLAIMLTAAFAVATLTMTTTIATAPSIEPVYAQLSKDPGASFLAPGEDPQIPGWDPDRAADDAPGQIFPAPCPACGKAFTPGQEGLKQGIIGPMIP